MLVSVDVFDDGQEPLTCARWFGSTERPAEKCDFLLTYRYGAEFCCGLFRDDTTSTGCTTLDFKDRARQSGLIPCKQCLEARKTGKV